ncbi:MAG: hypothetical protein R3E66_19905 [bacterium]
MYGYFHTAVEFLSGPNTFFLKYPKGKLGDGLLFGYLTLTAAFAAVDSGTILPWAFSGSVTEATDRLV